MFPTLHLNVERWKFNKEYNVYVSTMGRFKDTQKRDLPIYIDKKGYCQIKIEGLLGCQSVHGYKSAHRLVMETWKLVVSADNLTVDHLDHNKRNNKLNNLEWVSAATNEGRAVRDLVDSKQVEKNNELLRFFCNHLIKKNFHFDIKYEGVKYSAYNGIEMYHYLTKIRNGNYNQEEVKSWVVECNRLMSGDNKAGCKKLGQRNAITIKMVEVE